MLDLYCKITKEYQDKINSGTSSEDAIKELAQCYSKTEGVVSHIVQMLS